MNAVAGFFRRIWDALFAVTFALAGFQLPAFLSAYRQRLDQSALELDRLLPKLRESPAPDSATIAQIEAQVAVFRHAVDALGGSGIGRLRAFGENFDLPVVKATLALHEPSLPLTLEAAAYAAGAALLGLVFAAATAHTGRVLLGQHRGSSRGI